jgi:hypothetical protein
MRSRARGKKPTRVRVRSGSIIRTPTILPRQDGLRSTRSAKPAPASSPGVEVSSDAPSDPKEGDARSEVPETTRLQTRGGTRLDDPTIVGTTLVDRAWITIGDRHIEARASISVIFHEPHEGRLRIELRVNREQALSEPRFVLLEEVHGARSVMAAAAARDAVASVGIREAAEVGRGVERRTRHRRSTHL